MEGICQLFHNIMEGACQKWKVYQPMLRFIHDHLCRPNTPSSRNDMCWQEMSGLAWVLSNSWLLSTLLRFMSSSLLRPNIFLLLCSKEPFIPGQELFTVVMEEGALWASPRESTHVLEHPDTMRVGGSKTHMVPLTCGWLTPASFLFIVVVSSLSCQSFALPSHLQIWLFSKSLMWRGPILHLVMAWRNYVPFSASRQLHETEVCF